MKIIGTQQNRSEKKWIVRFPSGNTEAELVVRKLSRDLQISEVTARLLYLRGYRNREEALRFFRLEDATPHDPYLMKDMALAVRRLRKALENGERIAIYGDYDVDGVTSVSLLYLFLSERGADVGYYIPNRIRDGYGLSRTAIDRLHEQGVRLIVTVDTGITANEEVDYASSLGIDMIVTDHHECREELPKACAVVNPHRPDDSYPFAELAGVGVAFKLACAVEMAECEERGESPLEGVLRVSNCYADLVALGTVADVMPITDENRLIVAKGISCMEKNSRLGLQALIEAVNAGKTRPRKITSTFIGFGIAPRMNAAGRVSSASIAVELLLADTRERAAELAEQLCELNAERQTEENRIAEEAYRKIESMPESERSHVLVIDDDHWHQGIIGIVSSRLTERYGLPSILISYDGAVGVSRSPSDVGKGSGRSIKGLNLVDALTACEDLLLRFGGHELAAGLMVRRKDVEELRHRLNAYATEHLRDEDLVASVEVDCEVEMKELTMRLAEEIGNLEPFGTANPTPSFVLRKVSVQKLQPMGGGKHLRMIVEKDGISMSAVWFGKSVSELPFEPTDRIDLLFQLNVNEYQGVCSLQMVLQDAKLAMDDQNAYLQEKKRYEEILRGDPFDEAEDILPDREDIAQVYRFLRRESELGHTSVPMRRLLANLRLHGTRHFSYAKAKMTVRVLQELQLCNYTEPVTDHFIFEIYRQPVKTNLEKSAILHKLKSQMRKDPL